VAPPLLGSFKIANGFQIRNLHEKQSGKKLSPEKNVDQNRWKMLVKDVS
jgi:hypothetical protein